MIECASSGFSTLKYIKNILKTIDKQTDVLCKGYLKTYILLLQLQWYQLSMKHKMKIASRCAGEVSVFANSEMCQCCQRKGDTYIKPCFHLDWGGSVWAELYILCVQFHFLRKRNLSAQFWLLIKTCIQDILTSSKSWKLSLWSCHNCARSSHETLQVEFTVGCWVGCWK